MGTIRMNYENMEDVVKKLQDKSVDFARELESIQKECSEIEWSGVDAESYINAINEEMTEMLKLKGCIEEINNLLNQAVTNFKDYQESRRIKY